MSGGVERFFLRAVGCPWSEVDEETWVKAERACGFIPNGPFKRATAGFGNGSVEGRIVHMGYTTPDQYDWDVVFRDVVWPPDDKGDVCDECRTTDQAFETLGWNPAESGEWSDLRSCENPSCRYHQPEGS
jgi:hypothetical protein